MKKIKNFFYHFKVEFEKNCKVVITNKLSFSILFILPIFLIILMSMLYFNQNSYIYEVAMVGEENELSEIIENELQKSGFYIRNYQTMQSCSNALKRGVHKACIEIQPQSNLSKSVVVEIDNSNSQSKEILKNILQTSLIQGRDAYAIKNIEELLEKLEFLETTITTVVKKDPLLKQEFEKISKDISSLKLVLMQANRAFNSNNLDVEKTKETLLKISTSKNDFIDLSKDFSTQTNDVVENLSTTIENSNITTTQKTQFQDILDELESELDSYIIQRDSFGASSYYSNRLEEEIENFDKEITSTQTRLNSSFSSQNTIITSIDNSTSSIQKIHANSSNVLDTSVENTTLFTLRDSQEILYPYTFTIRESFTSTNKPLVSSFPFIFSSLLFIISLFLGAILSFKQNHCSSKLRIIMAKPSLNKLLFSQITSVVTLVFVQLLIIISIFYYVFLRDHMIDVVLFFPLFLLFIIVSTLFGMVIGHIAKSQLSLVIIALGTLFLLFLFSGKILPIELLHSSTSINYLLYNPYLLIESMLREILLFSLPLSSLYVEIGIILSYIVILGIIVSCCTSYHYKGRVYVFMIKIQKYWKKISFKKKIT